MNSSIFASSLLGSALGTICAVALLGQSDFSFKTELVALAAAWGTGAFLGAWREAKVLEKERGVY